MPADVIDLDAPFRGTRDYVWSADLLTALDRLAKTGAPDGYLRKIMLRKLCHHRIEAHFSPPSQESGTFQLYQNGTVRDGWLVETMAPIQCRIPFDEAAVRKPALESDGRVWLPFPVASYSAFEQLIVLLKILCAQIRLGAWLFAMLDLTHELREDLALELVLRQTMLGRGMMAEVRQSGQNMGRAQMILPAGRK